MDLDEIGNDKVVNIFCDNMRVVINCTNVELVLNKKHSSCVYHFNRRDVAPDTVSIAWMETNETIADVFTKRLPEKKRKYIFEKLRVLRLGCMIITYANLSNYIFKDEGSKQISLINTTNHNSTWKLK